MIISIYMTNSKGRIDYKKQLAAFNEIGKALTSSLDLKEILNIVMEKVSALMHPWNWSLLLLDEETGELRSEIVVGECRHFAAGSRIKIGEGIAGRVALEKKPLLVNDIEKDPMLSRKAEGPAEKCIKSLIAAPLVSKGRCLGVVVLINRDGGFTQEDLLMLTAITDYTAIAIENAIFFKKVQDLTVRDDLTRLYNSRFLQSRLEYEVERARRSGGELSLIFIDLDRFKDVNDRYGHQLGSRLLKEVAGFILSQIRAIDMACRYGGDEFIILMPETKKSNAMKAAGKIRENLRKNVFLSEEGADVRITASFGVASFPRDSKDKFELLSKADKAMYVAKSKGRDAVEAS